jgi:transitional endoplasmic reticulum ATPase
MNTQLLVGPPGTGKSQLARIVAAELLGRATVLVPTAGTARRSLRELLRLATRLAPSLVIVDDVDLVVGSRGGDSETLQEFLTSMDETMGEAEGVVVLASTNDPRSIDPAAVRASRFDTVVEMVAPGTVAREAVLRRHLSRFPGLDFARLAAATDGATGADLRDLARRAYLLSGGDLTIEAVLRAAAEGRWAADLTTGAYL